MNTSSGDGGLRDVEGLLGRMPDPGPDRESLLALGAGDGGRCRDLAAELLRQRRWRGTPLGELMPGLSLLPSPHLWERLGVRASNCLKRAGIDNTLALARKSPTGVRLLPEIGAKASGEIVQAALGAWAAAHLDPLGPAPATEWRALPRKGTGLAGLIGRVPDPSRDRAALLALRDGAEPAVRGLLKELRTDPSFRETALGELLPGIDRLETRPLFEQLSVRAANCLHRSGADSMRALAALTSGGIGAMERVGPQTVDEILALATSEWAASHLAESSPPPRADLPPPPHGLATAFEELEARPGFATFRRRRLEAGPRPSWVQLARERSVTTEAVRNQEAAMQARLKKSMRNPDWPIRIAVEELRDRLGAVARPLELKRALTAIDGNRTLEEPSHRQALLIHLAEYRVEPEWVLGPDIESLTDVILAALAGSGASSLDAVSRHLTAVGVREELQLPWIFSRRGFRIIDGELRPAAGT